MCYAYYITFYLGMRNEGDCKITSPASMKSETVPVRVCFLFYNEQQHTKQTWLVLSQVLNYLNTGYEFKGI